jgi:hypothetical protein
MSTVGSFAVSFLKKKVTRSKKILDKCITEIKLKFFRQTCYTKTFVKLQFSCYKVNFTNEKVSLKNRKKIRRDCFYCESISC